VAVTFYVTNLNANDVTAYLADTSGNIAPLSSGTGLASPFGIARDSSGNLYVTNQDGNTVTVYAPGSNGNSVPVDTIGGSNTGLDNPTGIAVDSSGNLYVANAGSVVGAADTVTIYGAGSSGNVAPIATITGANTGLDNPTGIALDSAGNLYVANDGSEIGGADSVTVFPPLTSLHGQPNYPNVTPSATISGAATGIEVPYGIAIDPSGNIYVANSASLNGDPDTVTVFPQLASLPGQPNYPNVSPSATISGASTGLNSPGGITVDSGGNIYVTDDGSVSGGADSLTVYAAGSNGNVAPTATISGGATGLELPFGVAIDSSGNLYVVNPGSAVGGVDSLTIYPSGSSGNTAPSATISSDTEIEAPFGIALDASDNIYVADAGSAFGGVDSVSIYPYGTYANEPPVAVISGDNTLLNFPAGIALDSSGNIYLANATGGYDGSGSVTQYAPLKNKSGTLNIAPTAVIAGDDTGDLTGFNFPDGVVVDSSGNVYVANATGGPDGIGSITIYPAGSNGNVAPTATISDNPSCAPCDNTELAIPYGIALDFSGNIYVANAAGGFDGLGSVTEYAPLGSNTGILNVAPTATIAGDASGDNTGFDSPTGVALDPSGNIYVTNDGSSVGGVDSVTVYPAGSNGNVAPSATISGALTGLSAPQGIVVDPKPRHAKHRRHKHHHPRRMRRRRREHKKDE